MLPSQPSNAVSRASHPPPNPGIETVKRTPPSVGASLLAKNSQAPRSFRKHALSLTFFASKLAPTKSLE
ncbi:hypothetical protein EUX53_17350 [Pseudomonas orientalis]|nr:hypothetical protein EUX53_17350 [Pseudomonas orientalis]